MNVSTAGWWGRSLANATGLLLISALLLGGCTVTTIVPPTALEDPAPVFVLDHGRHSSLVIPHPQGLVRYAYGDWAWYAQRETSVWEMTSAALWPTPAGFGRRVMGGPATADGLRQNLRVGVVNVYSFMVESVKADELRLELDALFFENSNQRLENIAYDLTFVPHPQSYTAFNNSNHKVAEWLERLDCRIEGNALWSNWRVVDPQEQGGYSRSGPGRETRPITGAVSPSDLTSSQELFSPNSTSD